MPITALAQRRITLDISKVMELDPSAGMFWNCDEADMTHGWAIVCACEDTPYHGGAFCFEVRFPDNYPFEPPVFTYLTNDGRTRFNPNLYKNGKVCLSLLNTWHGEPWSGVQSLMSVLQCIQTAVINQDPLVNEPAHPASKDPANSEIQVYNRMVFQATLETAILAHLATPPVYLEPVYDAVKAWVMRARPAIVTKARALAAAWDGKKEDVPFYQMSTRYRFAELATRLEAYV